MVIDEHEAALADRLDFRLATREASHLQAGLHRRQRQLRVTTTRRPCWSSAISAATGSHAPMANDKNIFFYTWFDAHDDLPSEKLRWADYVNYLQHRIFVGQAFWQSDNGRYTNLKYNYLKQIIPVRELAPMKAWLLGDGTLITSDGKFWEGSDRNPGKCLGYRVADKYQSVEPQRTRCRDPKLSKTIKDARRADYKNYTKVMRRIHVNIKRVDIDFLGALELLAHYKFEPTEGYDPEEARRATKKLLMIINDKSETMPHRCQYKRVHHEFTRLARVFRPYLKANGVPLTNVDIANSQPLFLYLAIMPLVSSGALDPEAVAPVQPVASSVLTGTPGLHADTSADDPIWLLDDPDFAPVLPVAAAAPVSSPRPAQRVATPHSYTAQVEARETIQRKACQELTGESKVSELGTVRVLAKYPDLNDYKDLVEGGKLYSYLMKQIGWTKDKQAFKDEVVFRFYYGPNNDRDHRGNPSPCPLKHFFAKRFPTVWAAIRLFKKKNGWKELAREMQRREATVMIDRVCVRLMEEHREVVWFPIHDSIVIEPTHADAAKAIMVEEFYKMGISPSFGITDYRTEREAA